MKQLALPPAPEPKLLPGDVYYVGIDWGSEPSVTIIEVWRVEWRGDYYVPVELVSSRIVPESAQ